MSTAIAQAELLTPEQAADFLGIKAPDPCRLAYDPSLQVAVYEGGGKKIRYRLPRLGGVSWTAAPCRPERMLTISNSRGKKNRPGSPPVFRGSQGLDPAPDRRSLERFLGPRGKAFEGSGQP